MWEGYASGPYGKLVSILNAQLLPPTVQRISTGYPWLQHSDVCAVLSMTDSLQKFGVMVPLQHRAHRVEGEA